MSGSRHKEQGRRPSSAGWWNRPWALLDEMLRMQCFMTAIAHLSVARDTHTQNTGSQVGAANIMLALSFWVSQLRGISLTWPVPIDVTPQANASAGKRIHFPHWPARCCLTRYIRWWNVLFQTLVMILQPRQIPHFWWVCSARWWMTSEGKQRLSPLEKYSSELLEHTMIYWTQGWSALI